MLKSITREDDFNHSCFLSSFCKFCNYKTIVEIGVFEGSTTQKLCEAARYTQGTVFGYDAWDSIFPYGNLTSKEAVELSLKNASYDNFKLTKVDTHSDEFTKYLRKDTEGKIDFAFIDGGHSYKDITNDFFKVYHLLSEEGSIAFHDTYSHVGPRKFLLDLYQKYNDGTFDFINLPYGGNENKRWGLTILTKRSYPLYKDGLAISQDPLITNKQVYDEENEWYLKQLKKI